MSTTKNISDIEKEITTLLAKGDRRAVTLTYQNYGNALYGIIRRIVKSEALAEEVLQDVMVKVWQNAASYNRTKGRLFTWLSNIARNAAIDMLRSAGYNREQKTTSIENTVNPNVGGSEELQIKDAGLEKVINSLDEKHRVLIDMAYFQGYSQRAVEKELDIPLGTIKSRLRQAINELRTKLNQDQVRDLLLSIVFVISMLQSQNWMLELKDNCFNVSMWI
ncbi:MAG: sigma-70 family RNA polymerase sigma factor [Bacteroidota bacterium]